MKKLFVLIAATLFIQILSAQDSTHILQKTYKVTLTSSDNLVVKGYLVSLTDSAVNIGPTPVKGNVSRGKSSRLISINYNKIDKVTLRRKGRAARGLLIGAASGAVVGVIAGYMGGDDTPRNGGPFCILCFTAAEKAKIGAVVFGFSGGALGTVVGAVAHKTFIIKGDKQNFDSLRSTLIH